MISRDALLEMAGSDPWQAIARMAGVLSADPDKEARLALLRDFCKKLWHVPEAHYFSIGRNLTDMADRPGKGTAAFLEYVARLGQPMVVRGNEVEGLAHTPNVPPILADRRWKSFILAPLTLPGRVVGVMVLADDRDNAFGQETQAQLHALLAQVAALLDGAMLVEEARYKDAYSRALGDIDMMIASYDVVEILRHGVRKVHETVDAVKVVVFLVNQETSALRVAVSEGCAYGKENDAHEEPCAKLAQMALTERKSRLMGPKDMVVDGLSRHLCADQQAIITPIMANNQVYGVLEVFDKRNGKSFHRNEVAFINQVALKLALVIQNTHAYMTINRLNEGLENKVSERTVQLESAIMSLQETQSHLMQADKLATIGTLAGGVAHEINNPLAAILANVQLLQLDTEDPEALESLGMIESGARRCKHIVENLLNYSRQSAPEHRSLSVNEVLQDTLDLLMHRLKHANVDVRQVLGELPPILAVATELGQVFTNLIVNALDALAEAHPPPGRGHLTIRTYLDGRHVIASIEDDGGGIEEHVIRKIFNPFFTTKQVGKGTGLGLAISQQITSSFGGRIEVQSEMGEGCTFKVMMPIAHGQNGTGKLPPLEHHLLPGETLI